MYNPRYPGLAVLRVHAQVEVQGLTLTQLKCQ